MSSQYLCSCDSLTQKLLTTLSSFYKICQKVHKKETKSEIIRFGGVVQFSEGDGWLLRNYWGGKGDYSKFELFEPTYSAGQKEQGRIIFVHSWIYLDYADWRALKMLPWFPVGRQDHPNTINSQIHLINPQITYKSSSRSPRHPWSQIQNTKSKQS